jgi:hypothetical protein
VPESASSDRDANGVVAGGLAVLAVEGLLPVLGAPTAGERPHRIVAVLGFIEASLPHTERAACPRLASVARWDAVEVVVRPSRCGCRA